MTLPHISLQSDTCAVAIRNDIREEIQTAVNEAITEKLEELKPKGIRRTMDFLKNWGAISALWAIPFGMVGIIVTLSIFLFTRSSKESEFVGGASVRLTNIEDRLKKIDEHLSKIDTKIYGIDINDLAKGPITPQVATKIASIVDEAQASKLNISEPAIISAGNKIINASDDATTWSAALKVASYRTSLLQAPPPTQGLPLNYLTTYDKPHAFLGTVTSSSTSVAPERAVQMYTFQNGDRNLMKAGPASLTVSGSIFSLDNFVLRHIVFIGVHIKWSGAPVSMEDVMFVNCTFELPPTPQTRQMMLAVVENGKVDQRVTG